MTDRRELIEKWTTHVFRPAEDEVRALVREYPDRRRFPIPYGQCGADYQFTAPLVNDPDRTLEAGREALSAFVSRRFDRSIDLEDGVYLRVRDVPDSVRVPLSDVRSTHLNRLVLASGAVERAGAVRPRIRSATFRCDQCDERTTVPQRGDRLREPTRCPSCGGVETLALRPDRSEYVDAQTVALAADDRTLPVSLEHDLADAFDAGERVDVVAIPRARPDGDRTTADLELEAVSVRRR